MGVACRFSLKPSIECYMCYIRIWQAQLKVHRHPWTHSRTGCNREPSHFRSTIPTYCVVPGTPGSLPIAFVITEVLLVTSPDSPHCSCCSVSEFVSFACQARLMLGQTRCQASGPCGCRLGPGLGLAPAAPVAPKAQGDVSAEGNFGRPSAWRCFISWRPHGDLPIRKG
jgi:hypothetical protein